MSTFQPTDPESESYTADLAAYERYLALDAAGVEGANTIGGVFYFQNAFDTVTQGIDIVGTYNFESEYGDTTITASMNFADQNFNSDPQVYFNNEAIYDFLNGTPATRGVLSVKHAMDDMSFTARMNYFGGYSNSESDDGVVSAIQIFEPEVMFDLEGTYFISEMLSVSAGARNLFDNYPDAGEIGETCCGRIYRSDSIVDWQGGYYYMRLNMSF